MTYSDFALDCSGKCSACQSFRLHHASIVPMTLQPLKGTFNRFRRGVDVAL